MDDDMPGLLHLQNLPPHARTTGLYTREGCGVVYNNGLLKRWVAANTYLLLYGLVVHGEVEQRNVVDEDRLDTADTQLLGLILQYL